MQPEGSLGTELRNESEERKSIEQATTAKAAKAKAATRQRRSHRCCRLTRPVIQRAHRTAQCQSRRPSADQMSVQAIALLPAGLEDMGSAIAQSRALAVQPPSERERRRRGVEPMCRAAREPPRASTRLPLSRSLPPVPAGRNGERPAEALPVARRAGSRRAGSRGELNPIWSERPPPTCLRWASWPKLRLRGMVEMVDRS